MIGLSSKERPIIGFKKSFSFGSISSIIVHVGDRMETIEEYSKSKIPLEERESFVYQTIHELDSDANHAFQKVFDQNFTSLEEINSTFREIVRLQKRLIKAKEAYDYLYSVEVATYDFALRRVWAKFILDAATTAFAYTTNPVLGIFSVVSLTQMAGRYFIHEKEEIDERLMHFNVYEQLAKIQITLDNCVRIFQGKDSLSDVEIPEYGAQKNDVLQANNYIILSLFGNLTGDDKEEMSKEVKERILRTIKKEATPRSTGLIDLYYELQEIGQFTYVRKDKSTD